MSCSAKIHQLIHESIGFDQVRQASSRESMASIGLINLVKSDRYMDQLMDLFPLCRFGV